MVQQRDIISFHWGEKRLLASARARARRLMNSSQEILEARDYLSHRPEVGVHHIGQAGQFRRWGSRTRFGEQQQLGILVFRGELKHLCHA